MMPARRARTSVLVSSEGVPERVAAYADPCFCFFCEQSSQRQWNDWNDPELSRHERQAPVTTSRQTELTLLQIRRVNCFALATVNPRCSQYWLWCVRFDAFDA